MLVVTNFYRCGECGHPTNEMGQPLTIDECNQLTDEQLNSAELVHGYCCEGRFRQTIIVTRDMAIDAGDLSLEGQEWIW